MVKRGRQLGLRKEAIAEALVSRELLGDELERDLAVQAEVLGGVDDAHAASSQPSLDSIARDLRPDARIGLPCPHRLRLRPCGECGYTHRKTHLESTAGSLVRSPGRGQGVPDPRASR
jgi:hypothetical protein